MQSADMPQEQQPQALIVLQVILLETGQPVIQTPTELPLNNALNVALAHLALSKALFALDQAQFQQTPKLHLAPPGVKVPRA